MEKGGLHVAAGELKGEQWWELEVFRAQTRGKNRRPVGVGGFDDRAMAARTRMVFACSTPVLRSPQLIPPPTSFSYQ